MSGGGMQSQMQQFPQASSGQAAPMANAQSVSQLQQILQKLGASSGGGQSPAMGMANLGMNVARMGQQPTPQMAPQARPAGQPMPMQAAAPPQMATGGMGMPMQGGQMSPGQLNALILQRGGLL